MKRRIESVILGMCIALVILFAAEVAAKEIISGADTRIFGGLLERSIKGFGVLDLIPICLGVWISLRVADNCEWKYQEVWTYLLQFALMLAIIVICQLVGYFFLNGNWRQHLAGWFLGASQEAVDEAIKQNSQVNFWDTIAKFIRAWKKEWRWGLALFLGYGLSACIVAVYSKFKPQSKKAEKK